MSSFLQTTYVRATYRRCITQFKCCYKHNCQTKQKQYPHFPQYPAIQFLYTQVSRKRNCPQHSDNDPDSSTNSPRARHFPGLILLGESRRSVGGTGSFDSKEIIWFIVSLSCYLVPPPPPPAPRAKINSFREWVTTPSGDLPGRAPVQSASYRSETTTTTTMILNYLLCVEQAAWPRSTENRSTYRTVRSAKSANTSGPNQERTVRKSCWREHLTNKSPMGSDCSAGLSTSRWPGFLVCDQGWWICRYVQHMQHNKSLYV